MDTVPTPDDRQRECDLQTARDLLRRVEEGETFYEACEYYVSVDVLAARLGRRTVYVRDPLD